MLEVFTHRSLRYEGAPSNEEFGDSARLAELGAQVLQMIVTWLFFSKRPLLKAEEIVVQRDEALSDANIEAWLAAYKLREKLRFAASAMSQLHNPAVCP
jgi:dsRNA-specific ribonuclease